MSRVATHASGEPKSARIVGEATRMDVSSIAPAARSGGRWSARHRRAAVLTHGTDTGTSAPAAVFRVAVVGAAILALANILADVEPLRAASWGAAVLFAGLGALLA